MTLANKIVKIFIIVVLIVIAILIYNIIIISKLTNNESISSPLELALIAIALLFGIFIICLIVPGRKKSKKKNLYLKIKELIEGESSRISFETFRKIIGIDVDFFNTKILDWALEYNFKIDGEYLIVNEEGVSDFINKLDNQFAKWEQMEKDKIDKL